MRTLSLEIVMETPDGNPWPLLTAVEFVDDLDTSYVIAEGVRVPALGGRLTVFVTRLFKVWQTWGALAAHEFTMTVTATQVPPRRR